MKTKISPYQTTLLLIVNIVPTAIVFLPGVLIKTAGRDAWISSLLLIPYSLTISIIYIVILKRMKSADFISFNYRVWGKLLTGISGVATIIYFLFLAGIITRELAEIMVTDYMPETPLWFFNITIIIVAAAFVYYGLEVIARSTEIAFYLFVFSFLAIIILLIKDMSPVNLTPILARGIKPVGKGVYSGTVFFSEFFVILILGPQMKKYKNISRIIFITIIIIGSFFTIVTISSLMLFGTAMTNKITFPLLAASRYAELFGIIERFDALFMFYWIGGGIFKTAIFFYGAIYTGKKLFNLSSYYILIPLFIPIIFYISFYYFKNLHQLLTFLSKTIPHFLSIQVLYPLLLLIVSLIRGIKTGD